MSRVQASAHSADDIAPACALEGQPLVSIVMPTFNRAAFITEAIASVVAQTYANWELLIADDGSTDDTASRVNAFQDARILFLAQPHCGRAAVMRNHALAHARGGLIAFLDSDDLWKPFKLEAQVQFLQSRPEIGLLYTRTDVFDEGGIIEVRPAAITAPQGHVFWRLCLGNFVSSNTVVVRANVINEVGLQCERHGISEDYEHWLRIARRFQFGFLPEVTAAYRRHEGNVSANLLREAIRGRDAILPILETLTKSRWRAFLARSVAEMRVLALAASDAEVTDNQFSELIVSRSRHSLVYRSAPLVRSALRALLSHRLLLERIASFAVKIGSKSP